ncbi:MAG: hydrogenase 4 subunit B [Candidatus Peregrinibacteria bacterium]|nr:hydrogenase 4 subunit B [Candidatus Peregrinibacteria bacterium]
MINMIASPSSFIFLLICLMVGAIGSLLLRKYDDIANKWSGIFGIIGSLWGIIFSISAITIGNNQSFTLGESGFQFLSLSFNIDALSAFFIFVISLIALFCSIYGIGYVKHFYKKYDIGALGFFYHLFLVGMLLVVSASNGIFFLIAWEIMSIASYFLVVYDRNDEQNVKAGFLYLLMTHVGTAFIISAFILLYKFTGSFDFEVIKANVGLIPLFVKDIIFVLAMIGFGTKAGIIPFHIWLPAAHPAAPSHVSGLMSGVMIKTGIYMMIRIFLEILQPVPAWWGLAVLVVGAVSALIGVLYALTEHDIKRLLAYHSIENIGIILLGLGSSLMFSSMNMPSLALLGFVATLFHTLNHATFKSLLFLSAGSVINATHTRNMEEYGGLIKYMPYTAFFFLIGSMAISALPPFNGFFSEWLTFQSLFEGIKLLDFPQKWIFISAAGSLAFTGGLALACFVKAFGSTFLARPRSEEVMHAKESSFSLKLAMGGIAVLALLFGVFSGPMISFIKKIGENLAIFKNAPALLSASTQGVGLENGTAYVSGPAFFIIFIIVAFIAVIFVKYLINKNQKIKIGATWDCGTDLTPRMEITSTGFARSIILIFKGLLKPSIQYEIDYQDSESRYLQKSMNVTLGVEDVNNSYIYKPLQKFINALSVKAKKIQGGNINAYILYIFAALIITLFLAL